VNGTNRRAPAMSGRLAQAEYSPFASATMERPSGVSSARRGEQRGLGEALGRDARHGHEGVAMRLPKVMVPVLSSSSVSTSPAASTARPEVARR
jgi:hypothetical protein